MLLFLKQGILLYFWLFIHLINPMGHKCASFIWINSPLHWLELIWDWFCSCGLSFTFAVSRYLCLGVNWKQVCLSVPACSTSLFLTRTRECCFSLFLCVGMPCSSDSGIPIADFGCVSVGCVIKSQLNTRLVLVSVCRPSSAESSETRRRSSRY